MSVSFQTSLPATTRCAVNSTSVLVVFVVLSSTCSVVLVVTFWTALLPRVCFLSVIGMCGLWWLWLIVLV